MAVVILSVHDKTGIIEFAQSLALGDRACGQAAW